VAVNDRAATESACNQTDQDHSIRGHQAACCEVFGVAFGSSPDSMRLRLKQKTGVSCQL